MNKMFQSHGIARASNPRQLFENLAAHVVDDAQFRDLLLNYEPEKRKILYEAMSGKLRFTPRSLESYVAEGRIMANNEKLPFYDHVTGQVTAYEDYNPSQNSLEQLAQAAINRQIGKTRLNLVCSKCKFEESFYAVGKETKLDVVQKSKHAGWTHVATDDLTKPGKDICPLCSKESTLTLN
jgi:hypothetical protein